MGSFVWMKAADISIVCARKMTLEFPLGKKHPFRQIASESGAWRCHLRCQLDPGLIVPVLKGWLRQAQRHMEHMCVCMRPLMGSRICTLRPLDLVLFC